MSLASLFLFTSSAGNITNEIILNVHCCFKEKRDIEDIINLRLLLVIYTTKTMQFSSQKHMLSPSAFQFNL